MDTSLIRTYRSVPSVSIILERFNFNQNTLYMYAGSLIQEENTGRASLTSHLADCKDIALDILDKCLLSLQGTEKKAINTCQSSPQ